MRIGSGNRSTPRKSAPLPLCPPHDLTWDEYHFAAVESRGGKTYFAKFEAISVVKTKVAVFWDVTRCSLVHRYWPFWGTHFVFLPNHSIVWTGPWGRCFLTLSILTFLRQPYFTQGHYFSNLVIPLPLPFLLCIMTHTMAYSGPWRSKHYATKTYMVKGKAISVTSLGGP
jgi:hypothetical protein